MLQHAITLLQEGKPVAFPTETVYGLGAPVFSLEALDKIYVLKQRPRDNPLIIHISNFEQLDLIVESYPEALARHFWPGPLTLILPKKNTVPSIVSAGLPFVGVRMPSHPLALELIEAVGPLAAPSANLSGRPSSTTADHVREDFGDKVFVLDGGPCVHGLESTVLALDPLTILRPGTLTKEELEEVLGEKIAIARGDVEKPLSPGMKYKHYAPDAKVYLVEELPLSAPKRLILQRVKPEELYALLRAADREGYEEIFIHCDPSIKGNAALMNRLAKLSQA